MIRLALLAASLALTGCARAEGPSSDGPAVPPTTSVSSARLAVTEIARIPTPSASFVTISEGWVAWASAATGNGTPDRVIVYNIRTKETRVVVDRSTAGAVIDFARLSGDLLVYGEQYPRVPGPEADVSGPWKIVITNLVTGSTRVLATDGSRRDLQEIRVSFDVDDTRVIWSTPAGKTSDGFPMFELHTADLDGGGERTVSRPGEADTDKLAGGRILALAPSSPTTVDVFEVDETDGSLRQLTHTGNVNRVAAGTQEFFVAEENRDGGLYLVKVPFDRPEQASDFGGRSSNVAVGDGFALWWPWKDDQVILAPLADTASQYSPPPRGRLDVPTRTAAHGDLAAWGEQQGPANADGVEIVVVRVKVIS